MNLSAPTDKLNGVFSQRELERTWATAISLIGYKLAEIDWIHGNTLKVVAGLFLISSGASIVNFFRAL